MNIPAKVVRNPMYVFRWLDWQFRRRAQETLTVETKQGLFTIYSMDTSIGKSLYCYREYEMKWVEQVIAFLHERGKLPGDGKGSILDIGANMGVISISLLCAGVLEKAIAIEPDPRNFALLKCNVHQNNLDEKFICLQYAVSDQEEKLKFELSKDNFGDHRVRTEKKRYSGGERYHESMREVIEVPTARIDSLIESVPREFTESLALIWVDVQGYEGYVFQGGRKLFLGGTPVQVEIWPYGISRAGMNADEFCAIVSGLWTHYWLQENGDFVCYPVADLRKLYKKLEKSGIFSNVIFMQD